MRPARNSATPTPTTRLRTTAPTIQRRVDANTASPWALARDAPAPFSSTNSSSVALTVSKSRLRSPAMSLAAWAFSPSRESLAAAAQRAS
jgi:hypothetical protein